MSEPSRAKREPLTVGDALGRVRLTTALAALGAVITAGGSIGPWVSTALGSVSGLNGGGDGWVTLGASVTAMLALLGARAGRAGYVVAFLAFLAALAVACLDGAKIVYVSSKLTLFGHQIATAGWGLYLTAAGALLGAVSLAAAAVATERDSTGRATRTRDFRVPAGLLVALVVAGTVTGGVLHERSQLNGQNGSASNAATIPTIPTIPTSSPSETTTTPATTTTQSPASTTTTTATTTPAAGSASAAGCPLETHPGAGGCVTDSQQKVYGTTDPGGGQAQWFTSPSGNIECELDSGRTGIPDGANCQTTTPPQTASVSDNGRVSSCATNCGLGNGPVGEYALAYGSETQLGPFICGSDAATGITCTIAGGGGGFSINRSGVKPISSVNCGTITLNQMPATVTAQEVPCHEALDILRTFRSPTAVEHQGESLVSTYWTLPGYPGWSCGIGAGGGACTYGADAAQYAFHSGG